MTECEYRIQLRRYLDDISDDQFMKYVKHCGIKISDAESGYERTVFVDKMVRNEILNGNITAGNIGNSKGDLSECEITIKLRVPFSYSVQAITEAIQEFANKACRSIYRYYLKNDAKLMLTSDLKSYAEHYGLHINKSARNSMIDRIADKVSEAAFSDNE